MQTMSHISNKLCRIVANCSDREEVASTYFWREEPFAALPVPSYGLLYVHLNKTFMSGCFIKSRHAVRATNRLFLQEALRSHIIIHSLSSSSTQQPSSCILSLLVDDFRTV
jgi:hypothetical protein